MAGRAGMKALEVADIPAQYTLRPLMGAGFALGADEKIDPATGRKYREEASWREFGSGLKELVTQNPIDSYWEGKEAFEQTLANPNMSTAKRVLYSGATDPLTYIGPGAVKSGLKFLPEAAQASKAFRLGAGLLESPRGASLGGLAGSAGAAQWADNEGLSEKQQMLATLGGGLVGGVAGGMALPQKALKGKGPLRGMGGSVVDPLGPGGERYMAAGARHGVDVVYDDNGFAMVTDPQAALRTANELQSTLPVLVRSGPGVDEGGSWNNNFFGGSRFTPSPNTSGFAPLEFTRELTPSEADVYRDVQMIRGLASDQLDNPMPDPLMDEPWLTNEHYEPKPTEYDGPNSKQARKGIKDAEDWVRRQISAGSPLGETLYYMKQELREGGRALNMANPNIGELAYYGRLDELIRNFSEDADHALARQHGLGEMVAPAAADVAPAGVGGAPEPAVGTPARGYFQGDAIEYTGNTADIAGGHFYEFRYLDGSKQGQTGHTQTGPDGVNPEAGRSQREWEAQQEQFRKAREKQDGTVKRVDLEGNVIDTGRTEAEINRPVQMDEPPPVAAPRERGTQQSFDGSVQELPFDETPPNPVGVRPTATETPVTSDARRYIERLERGETHSASWQGINKVARANGIDPTGKDGPTIAAELRAKLLAAGYDVHGDPVAAPPTGVTRVTPDGTVNQATPSSDAAGGAPTVPPAGSAAPPPAPPLPPTGGTTPPPGGPPPRPPRPTPVAPIAGTSPFQLPNITPTPLSRRDEWMNTIKRTLGVGVEENEYSSPAMRLRRRAEPEIKSHADRIASIIPVIRDRAFKVDQYGRIEDLPGQPTIQDVAARLPDFAPQMTTVQLDALNQIRAEIEPYTNALKAFGIEHGSRADVIEGGFYIPRGNAAIEGADAPRKVGSGRGSAGGKTSAERHARFVPGENDLDIESMSDAINNGYEYASLEDALRGHVQETGRRVTDKQVADYFKNIVDEDGSYIGETSFDQMNPAVRAEYQAAKKLSVRIQRRLNTATGRAGMATGKGDELAAVLERQATGAAQRASAGAESATEMTARMDAIRNHVTPPPRTAEAATNEINTLQRFISRSQKRINELQQRGGRHADEAALLQTQLDAVTQRLANVEPRYQRAIENSRQTPRDQGRIGLSGLEQHTFPDAIANAANKYLRNEKPPSGQGAVLLNTTSAFNNLLRGLKASADVSFMGIQGLIGAVHHPVDYGRAVVMAWKSLGDPQVLGKYLLDFDAAAAESGGMTSRQWIEAGLHIGGADTEFAIGSGLPALGDALGKGGKVNPIRGSNRAFGYFGDILRMELADTAYRNAAAHGFDMADPVNLRSVADVANNATGWSPNAFAGTTGQLAMFAPRFFQSQLDLIAKAATEKTIGGQEARRMLAKLIGTGTILTVAANEMSDRPIPHEELFDPRSPNFMRIRVGGQDVSVFGPWDSLLRGISNAAQGDVTYMVRTKASPALSMAWDLLSGDTFTGENARTPGEVLRNLLPFSLSQAPEAIMSATQGDIGPLGRVAIGGTGLKSAPMSPTEQLDTLSRATYGKDFYDLLFSQQKTIKEEHPDLWQRAVERKSSQSQRYELLKTEMKFEQESADEQLLSGTLTREDWKTQYNNRRQQMFGSGRALFGDKPITDPKTAEQRYIQIIDSNQDEAGAIDWDKVDELVSKLSPEDQAYIEDRQGVGNTDVVDAYKAAAKQRSEMFALPKYLGYTADEARAIDELWVEARTNAKTATPGALLAAFRVLLEDGRSVDPRIATGVRRRMVGTLSTLKQREKYAATHPLMVSFYGGAGKAGPLTAAERAALRGG